MYGIPTPLTIPESMAPSPTYKGMVLPPLTEGAYSFAKRIATNRHLARSAANTLMYRYTSAYDGGSCFPFFSGPSPDSVITGTDRDTLAAFALVRGLYPAGTPVGAALAAILPLAKSDALLASVALSRIAAAVRRHKKRCAPTPVPPGPASESCAPGYTMTCTPTPPPKHGTGVMVPDTYGFIGTSWLAYDKMVPQDPQLTPEEDPPRLCLDMASEEKLQNQRKFSMYIGGPAVFIAGSKLKGPFGLFIMGLGVACTVWHATAHKKVKEITGV